MTNIDFQTRSDIEAFYGQLTWALRRLGKWGVSEDPHVRYEAKCQAKTTLGELSRKIENGEIDG